MTETDDHIEPVYERPTRLERDEQDADRDREWAARRRYPNRSSTVAPRESDEYPIDAGDPEC